MFKVPQSQTMFEVYSCTVSLSIPAWAGVLDQVTSRGSFQSQPFCDPVISPSIYKSSVTEQQLRIGLIMKSLLCLTAKVGISCKSLLSSNLLWAVLISEGSAFRIWCCCIYSILSFIMQIKYYTPVLTYCQCSAWYFKTQPFGSVAIIQKVGIFFSCSFSKDFRCWNQST